MKNSAGLESVGTARPVTSIFDIDFGTQDLEQIGSQVFKTPENEIVKTSKKFKFRASTSGHSLNNGDPDEELERNKNVIKNDILNKESVTDNPAIDKDEKRKEYAFEKIPRPLSQKLKMLKRKSDMNCEVLRPTPTKSIVHNQAKKENLKTIDQQILTSLDGLEQRPSGTITPRKLDISTKEKILAPKVTPSRAISVPKFCLSKTPNSTPGRLLSMNQMTPRSTPSQGFECLSLSSILEEIGYEQSQISNIVPSTPLPREQGKRKLDFDNPGLKPDSPGNCILYIYAYIVCDLIRA